MDKKQMQDFLEAFDGSDEEFIEYLNTKVSGACDYFQCMLLAQWRLLHDKALLTSRR